MRYRGKSTRIAGTGNVAQALHSPSTNNFERIAKLGNSFMWRAGSPIWFLAFCWLGVGSLATDRFDCERGIWRSSLPASANPGSAHHWEWPVSNDLLSLQWFIREIDGAVNRHRRREGFLKASTPGYLSFALHQLERAWHYESSAFDPMAGNGIEVAQLPLSDEPRTWLRVRLRRQSSQFHVSISASSGIAPALLNDLTHTVFQNQPVGQRLHRAVWMRTEPSLNAVAEVVEQIAVSASEGAGGIASSFLESEQRRLLADANRRVRQLSFSVKALMPPPPLNDAADFPRPPQPILAFDSWVIDSPAWRIRFTGLWEYTLAIGPEGTVRVITAWLSAQQPIYLEVDPRVRASHHEVMELLTKFSERLELLHSQGAP
jgi:hypothetical protein